MFSNLKHCTEMSETLKALLYSNYGVYADARRSFKATLFKGNSCFGD